MRNKGYDPIDPKRLSADIVFRDNRWEASIRLHPAGGGPGEVIWLKGGMKSADRATTAMEAAWQRLTTSDDSTVRLARAVLLDDTASYELHAEARKILAASSGPPLLPKRCPDCDEVLCTCSETR
jgi:hypothetical protein